MITKRHCEMLTASLVIRAAAVFLLIGMMSATTWAQDDECHPVQIPNEEAWAMSAHADPNAEAFSHWDEDDPQEIPTSCAKCHSTPGHLDFLGADGSAAGVVDMPAPVTSTVECIACHNEVSAVKDTVLMPSGVELTGLGSETRCMECHQGRESGVSVDAYIADKGITDEDMVSEELGFRNIHYYPASATLYGSVALGGYQYEGKAYDVKFRHVEGIDSCVDCHDTHSLQVKVETCSQCHEGAVDYESFRNIRMAGSTHDYDGDGDVTEGISGELSGLQETLYAAMQAYANAGGAPIVYDSHTYPYFFNDTDGDGLVSEGEASYSNQYSSWTARLVKAAFNYQFSLKDPGAFAHNGKYMIQLLYDSAEQLDPTVVAGLTRDDVGHFAGSHEQWRHWDDDGAVPGSCSKCHSAKGLPFFLAEGVTVSQPLSNGLMCETCHDAIPEFTRRQVAEVEFPSGAVLDTGNPNSNICINCHQGRESTVSVNAAIGDVEADTVSTSLSFRNPHYFAAGATFFGTEAKGAYEYAGKIYMGRRTHVSSFDTCTECHNAHTLEVQTAACANPFCHGGATTPQSIRNDPRDFDGDGWVTEGLAGEIETQVDVLFVAIQDYATNVAQAPIIYDPHAYPYFFNDSNANGQVDPGEANYGNRYTSWTPRMLQAAYNFQYAQKDPGAFAHNGQYMIQILYDSLESLGEQVTVDMTGMVRP